MAFQPKVVDLDGLRVVLVKDDRQSVTVRAVVDAGSREETEEQSGAAHFLEHFVFKGTKKMPGVFDVVSRIEGVGGRYNAWTSHTDTGFWVTAAKEKLDLTLEVVGQLTTDPMLPEDFFDKERGTILQEYYMYEDHPGAKAGRTMWEALMGKTNVGRQVIGTLTSLRGMKLDYLKDFRKRWYRSDNVVVGVVGNYGDEKVLLEKIKKEFSGLYIKNSRLSERDSFSWSGTKKKLELITRKTDQAAVAIGLPGTRLDHPLRYARALTDIVFGSGSISKLFIEVREKRGWAYSVNSFSEEFREFGVVGIDGGFPKDEVADAVSLSLEIMMGLGRSGKWAITKKDLDRAKETFYGRLALRFDDPSKVLGMATDDLLSEGKIYTPEEIRESVKKVTLDEIKEYCELVFDVNKTSMGVVGDYEEMPVKI